MGSVVPNMFLFGVLNGVLLVLGSGACISFIFDHKRVFLFYMLQTLFLSLSILATAGIFSQYVWPEWQWMQEREMLFFGCATAIFALVFIFSFLQIEKQRPVVKNVFFALIASAIILFFLCFFDFELTFLSQLVTIGLCSFVLLVMALSISICRLTDPLLKYFCGSWGVFCLILVIYFISYISPVRLMISPEGALIYGGMIESVLCAVLLIMQESQRRQAVLSEQFDLVQQRSQEEFEYKVGERTLELEIALRELSEANQELEKLNTIDPLTSIRNRRYFDKRLLAESRRSRREQTTLALVMLDIDYFKSVNDTYGHHVGDVCLKQVASMLDARLKRPTDDVCRYGGEEFGIILPNTELDGALQLIESVRQEIESTRVHADGQAIKLTISAGVAAAIFSNDMNESNLLQFADKLLYEAKNTGRNRVKGAVYQENNHA